MYLHDYRSLEEEVAMSTPDVFDHLHGIMQSTSSLFYDNDIYDSGQAGDKAVALSIVGIIIGFAVFVAAIAGVCEKILKGKESPFIERIGWTMVTIAIAIVLSPFAAVLGGIVVVVLIDLIAYWSLYLLIMLVVLGPLCIIAGRYKARG